MKVEATVQLTLKDRQVFWCWHCGGRFERRISDEICKICSHIKCPHCRKCHCDLSESEKRVIEMEARTWRDRWGLQ